MKARIQLQTSIQLFSFSLVFSVLIQLSHAQIAAGHIDDFQNLSLNGWAEGAVSPNKPTVIASGGPAGKADAFVRNLSNGTTQAGGKWVMFNQTSNWTGNYTSAGVVRISMDVRNSGNTTIHLRLAFTGNGGAIGSTQSFNILGGSAWQSIEFDIDPQLFVPLAGGNVNTILSTVAEFRILSNTQPSNIGEDIVATVDIDNIRAEGVSAVNDPVRSAWIASPNPATDFIKLSNTEHVEPVDVILLNTLGQVLMHERLSSPYQLEINRLSAGLYFLKVDDKQLIHVVIDR